MAVPFSAMSGTKRKTRKRTKAKRSLTEWSYERIREAILKNGLPPGTALAEQDLAKRFAISKTPVREALIRLAHEGFVDISARKGSFVAKTSIEDLKEIFEMRSALEGLACELAVSRIPKETLAKFRENLLDAAARGDEDRLFRLGLKLHDLIMKGAGNKLLGGIVDLMRVQISRYSHMASRLSQQAEQSLRAHIKIVEALEREDGSAARRAMEEHIQDVKENLIRSML